MNYLHTYPARIDAGKYEDLKRIKDLDKCKNPRFLFQKVVR